MKHSHVARSLKKIESDHVTLIEFLLSLTRNQIKTNSIATHTHTKITFASKMQRRLRSRGLDHQGTTDNFRFVLRALPTFCHFLITIYSFTQVNAEYSKCVP